MGDLSFSVRTLRKNLGFTAVAILTLALGVGANTAIFSVVKAILLNPLPFPNAGQLVKVAESDPKTPRPVTVDFTTTHDLYLFDQALNHGLLLNDEMLKEAYQGYSYEKPGQKNYGLGWRMKELPDSSKIIYHNGWWRGFNSLYCSCWPSATERVPNSGAACSAM